MRQLEGRLIQFETSDGLDLEGFLSKGKRRTKTLFVQVHGMTVDFPYHLHWWLAEEVNRVGVDAFLINTRGRSFLSWFRKNKKETIIGTYKERFEDCVKDLEAAIATGWKLGYRKFILSGHSTGCQKVTYYQALKNDKRVVGLVLLAPGDDYNITRKQLKKKFGKAVRLANSMVKRGKGDELMPTWASYYSAKRFLSYADPKNPEAQLFNYNGEFKQFGRVRCPVLAIFGSKEEHKDRPIAQYGKILKNKTGSSRFRFVEISGADHGFRGGEKKTSAAVAKWIKTVK